MGQSRFLFRSQRLAVAALASHPGGSSLLPFPPSPWGDGPGVRALCSPFGRGAGGGGCWRESLDRHQRRQTVSFVLPFSPSPLPPSPFSLSPLPLLPPSLRHVRIRGVRDSRAAKRLLISDFREQWRDWVNHHQWSPMVREKKQGSTTYYRMEVPCGKVSRTVVLARRDPMARLWAGADRRPNGWYYDTATRPITSFGAVTLPLSSPCARSAPPSIRRALYPSCMIFLDLVALTFSSSP